MKINLYSKFVSVFVLLFFLNTAFGQKTKPIIIGDDFQKQSLAGYVDIYETDNLISADSFWTNKSHYTKLPSDKFVQGLTDKFFWVVLHVKNTGNSPKNLILRVNNPLIDSIFFYRVINNSNIQLLSESGDEIPFVKRRTINELPVFTINMGRNSSQSYILMLRKRKNIKFPLSLFSKKLFTSKTKIKLLFHSLYFGGILIIFFTTLVVSYFIRSKLLLSYSVYIFLFGIFMFAETGYAFEFIFPNVIELNSALRVPLSMITLLAFMLFTEKFLEIQKYKKNISKIFQVIYITWIGTYLISLPFLWISPSNYHTFILFAIYIFNGLALFTMLAAVITVFKYNKRNAIVYILGVLILIVGAVVFSSSQFGSSNATIEIIHPLILSSVGEFFVFSMAMFFYIKRIIVQRNQLILKASQQEKEILRAQVQGNENANNRISSELHDNIGSNLALVKNKILSEMYSNSELSNDIGRVYNNVRDISHRLSSGMVSMLGCQGAVEDYLEEINSDNIIGITAELYCEVKEEDVAEDIKFQIFRIVQEAVFNCVKHAGKANVQVRILRKNDNLSLIIEDNGKGFDVDSSELKKGIGFQNIKMRTNMINGKFTINSEVGKGTKLVVIIPLVSNEI